MPGPTTLGALTFGLVALAYATARAIHEPSWPTDFDQLWHAGAALRQGLNPYDVVGPGKAFQWDWPLYYPLPAVLIAAPFSWLPVAIARVSFATVAGAVLGWAMGPRFRYLWPAALSAAFLMAVARTQWSPLLLAAAWVPALAIAIPAKPNVGLASLASLSSRRSVIIAVAAMILVIGASFVLFPGWIAAWRGAIASAPHIVAPIARPGGFVLALATVRWKQPEARLFLCLACLPHTPSIYDLLPLFFVCRATRDALVLALLTHAAFWANILLGGYNTFDAYAEGIGRFILWIVYVPVMLMVLRAGSGERGVENEVQVHATPRLNLALTGLLIAAAFFATWLPLVTTR